MRIGLAGVLVLWTAASVAAQPPGRITGTVQDPTGAPIAGVTVALVGAADRTIQTDADGRFNFADLPDGEYAVTAALTGFATASKRLRLAGGEAVAVVLRLWLLAFERVTVTAAKTGERDVQTTPLAVSVLSGSRAAARAGQDRRGHRRPARRALTFSQNTGFSQLTIRGIGTNAVFTGADPSSAVYVDGVYLARPAMVLTEFLDLERVEVLRGPQGTLYGRNAVGGALNVITRLPTDDRRGLGPHRRGKPGRASRRGAASAGPIVRGQAPGQRGRPARRRAGVRARPRSPGPPAGRRGRVRRARGKLQLVLGPRADLLLSGDVTASGPDAAHLREGAGGQAGVRGRQPARSPRGPRVDARAGAATCSTVPRPAQRCSSRRRTTLTSLTAYRKLDYDVLVGHRHHRARADRVARARDPAPVVRGAHARRAATRPVLGGRRSSCSTTSTGSRPRSCWAGRGSRTASIPRSSRRPERRSDRPRSA